MVTESSYPLQYTCMCAYRETSTHYSSRVQCSYINTTRIKLKVGRAPLVLFSGLLVFLSAPPRRDIKGYLQWSKWRSFFSRSDFPPARSVLNSAGIQWRVEFIFHKIFVSIFHDYRLHIQQRVLACGHKRSKHPEPSV